MFERGKALQRLALGEAVDTVMEEMSKRIMEKLLHPIFKVIQESAVTSHDAIKSRAEYESKMYSHKPVADHVDGNLFDKLD
jgi:glutamyl-tRNA reductase